MATVHELLAQREQLQQQIAGLNSQIDQARQAERLAVVAMVKEKIAEFDLTPQELFISKRPKVLVKKPRGKVAIKYRDPATGSTWTGRGIKPRWLAAELAAGRKIEDFAI